MNRDFHKIRQKGNIMESGFKHIFEELCEEKGVKIKQVSTETNINERTLYKLCSRNVYPSFVIALKLCNYFNCSIDYFLGLSEIFEKDIVYSPNEFIKNYANLLSKKNKSLYRITKDTGIGLSRIYDWQNGNSPNLTTLVTLAKYFNITVDELIRKN